MVQEKLHRSRMTGSDIVDWMNANSISRDTLIVADNARPEIIEQIKNAGYMIKACEKGKNSIQDGISKVQEFDLMLRGENLIKEAGSYCWKLDKN
jgi:phage terminase large subunit